MSQIRIVNFGDTLTSKLIGTILSSLSVPGVYEGYDVVVIDPQTIEIHDNTNPSGNIGYLLLPDGVLLSETLPVRLTFSVFPNSATVFTVVATHLDAKQFGGSAATYEIRTGFYAKGAVADGTVIAWVYYPGHGVALSDYMIVQPTKERLDSYVATALQQAPWTSGTPFDAYMTVAPHHTVTTEVAAISPLQSGTWPQTVITSNLNTVGTETTSFRFSRLLSAKPSKIDVQAFLDPGCSLQLVVYDTNGAVAAVSPASAFPGASPGVWAVKTVRVPPYTPAPSVQNGTWVPEQLWSFDVRFNQPLSKTCRFAGVTVSFDPTLAV